jgi:hypothetical protein
MKTLHLHLKWQYFDAIQRGEKKQELRLASKWKKKLDETPYTKIKLYRGFQKAIDGKTVFSCPYVGYELQTITHHHFGTQPVEVCAIFVGK